MRLKLLLILSLCAVLLWEVDAATRDRKKNRNKNRNDDQTETDEEVGIKAGSGFSEDRRKETKDRVMQLVERGEEREERKHEKKEEESSEEKDDKKKNDTEIVIPKRLRRTFTLQKAEELNGGKHEELNNQEHNHHHAHRRRRHEHELKKAQEINDGQKQPIANAPSQTHKCDGSCNHQAFGDTAEVLSRVRRDPSKKEQLGHRAASHPHKKNAKNAKKIKKQERLRRELNENSYYKDSHTPYNYVVFPDMDKEGDVSHRERKLVWFNRKLKQVYGENAPPPATYEQMFGRARRHPREINDPTQPDDLKEARKMSQDKTLVAADAGEIRE